MTDEAAAIACAKRAAEVTSKEARAVIDALVSEGHMVPADEYELMTEARDAFSQHVDRVVEGHERAEAELVVLREQLATAVDLVRKARHEHYYCEDCWYSCPKAPDGCCDDSVGDECNCGADAWNARIDAFLADYQEKK